MDDENAASETEAVLPAPQAAENGSHSKEDESRSTEPDEQSNSNGDNTAEPASEDTPTAEEAAATEEPPKSEGSSTYSANTVAAISSLLNDESPLFHNANDNNSASTLVASNKQSKNYELTVSDRATAIMSVYRDYLYEGLNVPQPNQAPATTNEPLMIREGDGQLLLLEGDLNNIKIERSGSGILTAGGGDDQNLQLGQQILTPQDLRKEEIKLATLEKFCSEGSVKKRRKKKKKKKDGESKSSTGSVGSRGNTSASTGSHSRSTARSANSKSTLGSRTTQTAASTTAAFRLKADVALRTLSSATTTVITKAGAASRTTSTVIKTKYKDSTTNIDKHEISMNNDYDFENYNGLAPPSTGLDNVMEDMEYGISPLGDKGLVFRSDGEDDDDDMSFRDICNDLGVTNATHPLDKYNEKRSYKYPIFRSKKFRKATFYGILLFLVGIVAVSIASAITNGFAETRKRNSPPLPDYTADEEWREHQKEEWEEEHGQKYTGYNNVAVTVPDIPEAHLSIEDVLPPPPLSKDDTILQGVSSAYRPVWFDRSTGWMGQTYQEAMEFCSSYNSYMPCPYEVYCPLNKKLLSGIMDHDGESWSAVINMNNEWVQVGIDGECDLYTQRYGKEPTWGMDGENNEVITRHIMCCRSHPMEEGSVWDVPGVGNEYVHKPVVGPGNTESVAGSVSENVEEASAKPDEPENNGAAVAAGPGADNLVDAQATTESTHDESATNTSDESNLAPDSTSTSVTQHHDITAAEVLSSMTEWEIQVQTVHHPAWFSNEFGWEGTTHDDAEEFCESIPHGASTLELCPLQAYCPNGPRDEKQLYLQMDAYKGEQWAPVKSTNSNEWVMVGMLNKDPSSTCRTYNQLHHKQPSWGIDGSKVDIKKHILCCERFGSETGGNTLLGGDGLAATDNAMVENSATDTDAPAGHVVGFPKLDNKPDESSPLVGNLVEMVDWYESGADKNDMTEESGTNNALTDMVVGIQNESNSNKEDESLALEDLVETVDWYQPGAGNESPSSQSSNGDAIVSSSSQTPDDGKLNLIYSTFDPMWFDSEFGWNGGSHADALKFCEKFKSGKGVYMELCPYAAYCPYGPSKPAIGGHQTDFKLEGEQWAPVYGHQNHWVLITMKGSNLATQCLSYIELHDEMPSWGLDDSNKDLKKHIMCCSPLQ